MIYVPEYKSNLYIVKNNLQTDNCINKIVLKKSISVMRNIYCVYQRQMLLHFFFIIINIKKIIMKKQI
jgi:hypothetical protein